jgi:archaemetzincin
MIHVVAVGDGVDADRLRALAEDLARRFRVGCQVREEVLDAGFARDAARGQYHSTAILERLRGLAADRGTRVLGVTALDLFVPIFTFVFGEAQLEGHCALVSWYRLAEEHYGLPADERKLRERLEKEAVHELGHTFRLRHCEDWRCVMASSHSVERMDVKGAEFCQECARAVNAGRAISG